MIQKFKTKQSLIKKIASSNHMPYRMKKTLTKNNREAEDESDSYKQFAVNQMKNETSQQLNTANNLAIKNIQSNYMKKKYSNQTYADMRK